MAFRKTAFVGVGAIVLAGAAYPAYDWYTARDVRLTQEPKRSPGALRVTGRESILNFRVEIPLELLRNAAQQAIPQEFRFGDNGAEACLDLGVLGRRCAGTRYEGTVRRTGDLAIAGNGNSLSVTLPITKRPRLGPHHTYFDRFYGTGYPG
jgi:hypothetical protein